MNLNEPWRFLGQRGGELGLGYGRITSLKMSQFKTICPTQACTKPVRYCATDSNGVVELIRDRIVH